MQIHNITITSVEALKENFSIPALWDCAENGTLCEFERRLTRDPLGIAKALTALLENVPGQSGQVLLREGKLDWPALEMVVKAFGDSDVGYNPATKQSFLQRSRNILEALVLPLRSACSEQQARELLLFLLLHLQAKPKASILPEDAQFLAKRLAGLTETAAEHHRLAAQLCLCGGKCLLLQEGKIWELQGGAPTLFMEAEHAVAGFACTERLGLIAFDADGALCGAAHPSVQRAAAGQRIQQAAAFGEHFALLTADGRVATNLRLPAPDIWTEVRWLQLGLNSLAGIVGPMRRAIQLGADPALEDYSDVRTVHTRSGSSGRRFALLGENGELHLDGGRTVEGVCAACLSEDSYLYAADSAVRQCRFGEEVWRDVLALPEGFRPLELHASNGVTACGGLLDGRYRVFLR